jgi:phosphoribosylanthranilate isomerase
MDDDGDFFRLNAPPEPAGARRPALPAMRPRVKICGLTRAEDARLAVQLGADFAGVVFYPASPRHVAADQLPALLSAIPAGRRVAVDVAPTLEQLRQRQQLGFNFFQIHFDPAKTSGDTLRAWSAEVGRARLWLAPRLPPGEAFPAAAFEAADTLLVDTFQKGTYGGSGRTGDWPNFTALRAIHPQHHWVLSGGLRPENIRAALQATRAEIVDVNSGVEISPGVKCAVKLDLLFANLGRD